MVKMNHVHTLCRFDKDTMKCSNPYCSFKAANVDVQDKATCCNICGEEFVLTRADIKRYAKPRCINCKTTKKAKEYQEKQKLIQDIFKPELTEQEEQEEREKNNE